MPENAQECPRMPETGPTARDWCEIRSYGVPMPKNAQECPRMPENACMHVHLSSCRVLHPLPYSPPSRLYHLGNVVRAKDETLAMRDKIPCDRP